jgi:hypothetical protein
MQDKSINKALLALRKAMIQDNLDGLGYVKALIVLRGVELPRVMVRCAPVAKRNAMRRLVRDALRSGPMTRKQLVDFVSKERPDVPLDRLYWRVDSTLDKIRLADAVGRRGRLWAITPPASNTLSKNG